MNGYAGYNSTVTNNGAESTWHHIKDIVKSNGTTRINVFIKSLFAHLEFKGEETYATQKFKYSFPVHPEASPETWRNVQRWRSELMYAFRIFQGNAESFGEYVVAFDTLDLRTGRQESIYNIIMSQRESGFLFRERDIMIIMLPSVSLIKQFKKDKYQDWVPWSRCWVPWRIFILFSGFLLIRAGGLLTTSVPVLIVTKTAFVNTRFC